MSEQLKRETPVTKLAAELKIDTGRMNQKQREDAVCDSALARIQELEKNRIPVGYAVVDQAALHKLSNAKVELEAQVERLRGQVQNCVNYLDKANRSFRSENYDKAIESANKALYETLIK